MALLSPENRVGEAIIVSQAIMSFLAIVTVGLRIWARKLRGMRLDGSDWMCFLGLIMTLVLFGTLVYDISQGLGLPMEEVTRIQYINFNKSIIAGHYVWTTGVTLIRISTLLLYTSVFPLPRFVSLCWTMIALNLGSALATSTAVLLVCRPIRYNWDRSTPGGHCGSRDWFYLLNGILHLINDVIVVFMPMPLLWGLRLPLFKKTSLIIMFGMGLAICVITLARIVETRNGKVERITQDYVSVALLTMLELILGVINCSLPLLKPVGQKLKGSFCEIKSFRYGDTVGRPNPIDSITTKRKAPKTLDLYPLDMITQHTIDESNGLVTHTISGHDDASVRSLSSSETRTI